MSVVVVDSSVAIKWYVPESHHEAATLLLEGENELHTPDLLPSEFGNVLWKKIQRDELTEREVTAIVRALRTVPFRIHPSLALLEGAMEIALRTTRTVYDSVYVALAVALDCPFVTADTRLSNALRSSAFSSYVRHVAQLKDRGF